MYSLWISPFFLFSCLGLSSTGGMNACSRWAFRFPSAATWRFCWSKYDAIRIDFKLKLSTTSTVKKIYNSHLWEREENSHFREVANTRMSDVAVKLSCSKFKYLCYMNYNVSQGFPAKRIAVTAHLQIDDNFLSVFDYANQLLTCHSPFGPLFNNWFIHQLCVHQDMKHTRSLGSTKCLEQL